MALKLTMARGGKPPRKQSILLAVANDRYRESAAAAAAGAGALVGARSRHQGDGDEEEAAGGDQGQGKGATFAADPVGSVHEIPAEVKKQSSPHSLNRPPTHSLTHSLTD